jgi:hypothetical protein
MYFDWQGWGAVRPERRLKMLNLFTHENFIAEITILRYRPYLLRLLKQLADRTSLGEGFQKLAVLVIDGFESFQNSFAYHLGGCYVGWARK